MKIIVKLCTKDLKFQMLMEALIWKQEEDGEEVGIGGTPNTITAFILIDQCLIALKKSSLILVIDSNGFAMPSFMKGNELRIASWC